MRIPVKEIITLGVIRPYREIHTYDFTDMGWKAAEMMEWLHNVVYDSFLKRDILSLYDWSIRTKNVFLRERLETVGHVINVPKERINNYVGCGSITRQEIYLTFREHYKIELKQWHPIEYNRMLANNRANGDGGERIDGQHN